MVDAGSFPSIFYYHYLTVFEGSVNFKCWSWPVLAKHLYFVNSERPTVCDALISTSLAFEGSIHLTNFAIAYLEQVLAGTILENYFG